MSSNHSPVAFIHNQVQPLDQAFLHISDLAIQRGYGIFDFFRIHQQKPLFLSDYLDRFYQSASLMNLSVPLDRDALTATIALLIQKNNFPVSGMKLLLTGGYSADGYLPGEPNLIIIQQALSLPVREKAAQGLKLITQEYVRELPLCKSINYSMGLRLLDRIRQAGADDVLYYQDGVITELPRCNFFIVKADNTVATPAGNVLQGITRKNVLTLARRIYPIAEQAITLADVFQAKEAFLTSTTKRIMPVVQIDGQFIGNGQAGKVTQHLLQELISLEDQECGKSFI